MACPICSCENLTEWYPSEISNADSLCVGYAFSPEHTKTFRVVRCTSCSHAFCSPIPEGVSQHYVDSVDEEYLRHSHSRKLTAEAVLPIIKNIKKEGALLDIGCSTGDFLSVAKECGYSVEGLELSRWSSQIAKTRGLEVHQDSLKNFSDRYPERYDVVTLWGVIEHFEHPAREIQEVKRLLKQDGLLVIWTGDVDSITSRVLGRKWWYWLRQHIQYFSHHTLKLLVERAGFKHLDTRLYPIVVTYETVSNSLRRYRWHMIISRLLMPFFALKPVWYLRVPGEMLFLAQRHKTPPAGASF